MSKAEGLREAQLWLKNATDEEIENFLIDKREGAKRELAVIRGKERELNKAIEDIERWLKIFKKKKNESKSQEKPKKYEHPYYWAGFQLFGAT